MRFLANFLCVVAVLTTIHRACSGGSPEVGIHVRATVDAGPSSMTSWWTSDLEDSEFWWIKRGRGKDYHLVEVQALSELSLGVHCSVVGDQNMVCEYGFFVVS